MEDRAEVICSYHLDEAADLRKAVEQPVKPFDANDDRT